LDKWLKDTGVMKNNSNSEHTKLSTDLIPFHMWGKNVRAIVSSTTWEKLRWRFGALLNEPVGNNGGYMMWEKSSLGFDYLFCEICGSRPDNLHLHELWEFDDVKLIQRLTGFKSICEGCHNAIHYGRASVVGLGDQSLEQLIRVNEWSKKQAEAHVANALEKWNRRRDFHYQLDINFLYENNLVPKSQVHMSWLERPRRVRNRLDALSWSQTLLSLSNAVIIDTETTGLVEGPEKNPNAEVIELAIISVRGKVLFNARFKPIHKIPAHVTEIHGIKDSALKKAPSFAEKYPEILKILHGKIVVAYNSRFDQKVIENTCRLHNLNPATDVVWECAMWAYKGYQESPRFLKLPNSTHSALADCNATLEIIQKMSKNINIPHLVLTN